MRISDWSSDVCSSDLPHLAGRQHQARFARGQVPAVARHAACRLQQLRLAPRQRRSDGARHLRQDRKSVVEGKSMSVRVDLGGRRIITKKKKRNKKRDIHTKQNRTTTKAIKDIK